MTTFAGTSRRISAVSESENDMSIVRRVFARVALFAGALLGSAAAMAQSVQVLDSVDAFGPWATPTVTGSAVLEMGFRDGTGASRLPLQSGTPLIACQRALDQGLYCLDGPIVRFWPDTNESPQVPSSGGSAVVPHIDVIDCRDPAFGFDRRRPNPCTSITVDYTGALWLAGRKNNSHSMVQAVRTSDPGNNCAIASGWFGVKTPAGDRQAFPTLAAGIAGYCALEVAPGRPVIVDSSAVDGELANGFLDFGPGILALEERKTVVFFRDVDSTVDPIPLGSGRTDWGLASGEQLLGTALLQFGTSDPKNNYVLVTTSLGRVVARKVDGSRTTGFTAFSLPVDRCNKAGTDHFGIRVSSQSGQVYVSDRRCQQVIALRMVAAGQSGFPGSCEASDPFCLVDAGATFATVAAGTTVYPDGISVTPGIGIDLNDCGFNADGTRKTCRLAPNRNGNTYDGATLSGVKIVDATKSGLTVFQVRGIPDCRHWPSPKPVACGSAVPAANEFLNLTPLLPSEVVIQLQKSLKTAVLPELLVAPKYRGQDRDRNDNKYEPTIDLFFGIPEDGVKFQGKFDLLFDVADLAGDELKCDKGVQVGGDAASPDLAWDVSITISERTATVGGPYGRLVDATNAPKERVSMLVNTGCTNPSQVEGPRWSLYAYNMEMYDVDGPGLTDKSDDAIYAKLIRSLNNELIDTQKRAACAKVDGQTTLQSSPIADCAVLETKFQAAEEKLDRCISSSTYPRQSAAVNNCQSFLSQLAQYRSALDGIVPVDDPANRLGELKVRADVLAFVTEYHYVPSIPPAGFIDCDASCSDPDDLATN